MEPVPMRADLLAFRSQREARFGDPDRPLVVGFVAASRGRLGAVDVAHWQGAPNWPVVRHHTTGDLVFWKATQGARRVDPQHLRNRAEVGGLYRHRLAYHWLDHDVPIADQCRHVIATLGTLDVGEGIMLDVEEDGITEAHAYEAAGRLEDHYGRPVAIYTGAYVDGGRVWNSARLFNGSRPRIFAAYTTPDRARKIAGAHSWDVWQFTGSATVPGITTLVDGNQIDNLSRFGAVVGRDESEDTVKAIDPHQRVVDTRSGVYPDGTRLLKANHSPAIPGAAHGALTPAETLVVPFVASEVVLNVTAIGVAPDARGYVTVWGAHRGATSSVNWSTDDSPVANLVRVRTAGGLVHLTVSSPAHLIVDLQAAG